MLNYQRIVIKLGTSVLTADTPHLSRRRLLELVRQVAHLHGSRGRGDRRIIGRDWRRPIRARRSRPRTQYPCQADAGGQWGSPT